MEEENYTVYKHVNKINGKVYVGITGGNVQRRWRSGKGYKRSPHFRKAIEKYGWDNFDHIIILKGISKETACIVERKLIKRYKSRNPKYGYNIASGGQSGAAGTVQGPTTLEKKREASLRSWRDPKIREARISAMVGRVMSEEARRNMSLAQKGHFVSEETKKKVSDGLLKYYSDPEARKRRSDSVPGKTAVRCVETGIIYDSSADACRQTGVSGGNIHSACRGKRNTAGGFHWEFYFEEDVAC